MSKLSKKIYIYESCTSTNDLAKSRAEQGEEEGTVFLAKEQTAGRGREGKKWFSEKNKGLYFSLILRPSQLEFTPLFSLMGALCCLEAIKKLFNLKIKIKWPNDLIYQNKKLGGVLGEASYKGSILSYLILGFGINTNCNLNDFPEELRNKVTSLKIILEREIENLKLMNAILERIDFWYKTDFSIMKSELITSINEHSIFKKGENLKLKTTRALLEGKYEGIDKNGALLLYSKGKKMKIYSGQLIM